jgi:hypothetical protein
MTAAFDDRPPCGVPTASVLFNPDRIERHE